MSSTKYKLGLSAFQMGAIAGDGGMGTTLVTIGDTVLGSASLTQSDDSTTDFNIEESDSPVLSIVSTKGKLTVKLSTYNNSVDNLIALLGGTKTNGAAAKNGVAATLGTLVGGTGYVDGTYSNISLTGGGGTSIKVNITVAGGIVTNVTIADGGQNYVVNDTLTTANTNLGGTGSGFSIRVATITTTAATGDTWNAPDTFLEQEQSIKLTFKQGGYMVIPRGKVSGKPNWQFNKTALSQVDLTIDVLQPNKPGVPRLALTSD